MRSAGILMPVASLPSPWGIGSLGQAARDFIDFLHKGGQTFWQILPISPTGYGDSPYQSFSSYAGNPYLIDLDDLQSQDLLMPSEYQTIIWSNRSDRIDYGLLYRERFKVLRHACRRLLTQKKPEFYEFCVNQAEWLEDYALFMSLKEKFGGVSWQDWPYSYRVREQSILKQAERDLSDDIQFWKAAQFLFFQQWYELKRNANSKGISIIGDLPIYVSPDSSDIWSAPDQFQLDKELIPIEVAGCPPDGFSADGQLWGNPLFDWDKMAEDDYSWWVRRIGFQFDIYDVLRIDHFRGFDAYYAIPFGEKTAKNGIWRPGPGLAFFESIEKTLGKRRIIAEDLGFLTPSVYQLLKDTGYPGMKVLEFAFDSRDTGAGYLPHTYPTNCVVYTGTHDNDTIIGWMKSAPQADVKYAQEYLRLNKQEGYNWGMIRSAWASAADTAIIQLQDLLGLGSEARINIPSTLGGNWVWRCGTEDFSNELADRLYHEMEIYHRLPESEKVKPKGIEILEEQNSGGYCKCK